MSLRNLVAKALYRINPYWDEISWNREHDRLMREAGLVPCKYARPNEFKPRPVHVVVVPQVQQFDPTFEAGHRDLYYEAGQRLKELLGPDSVTFMQSNPSERSVLWQTRLIESVEKTNATHVLTHIETDPGDQLTSWTWDQAFARLLDLGWDGALLGVNFDSAFKWILARSRRLARMSPQFMAVDICMPLSGQLVKNRVEVGPVNMPVSQESLELVNDAIEGQSEEYDVSFIGALYPYRVELIESLRARGINVAVNPHRPDITSDFASSRSNQPSWLDYMRGLASSHITINFSQSSAGPVEQLKTRVIEATLAGTYLLTDDKDRTRLFFEPDEFSTFDSIEDLPALIESLLVDRSALDAKARKAKERARSLALTDFWTQIDEGLRVRGLPQIFS